MPSTPKLVLATANEHKHREMSHLLESSGWDVVTAPQDAVGVEETGASFEENARIKALAAARATSSIALADDSGLVVDALDGAPGVHSRRWAGAAASDADRIAKLLDALHLVPPPSRTARFICSVCIASPNGVLWEGIGTVEGSIAMAPQGVHGFGYDPVFIVDGGDNTMAELDPIRKNAVSHRGRAMALAAHWLREHAESAIQ
jgi:XTP/dITP diphosphohydrolase